MKISTNFHLKYKPGKLWWNEPEIVAAPKDNSVSVVQGNFADQKLPVDKDSRLWFPLF